MKIAAFCGTFDPVTYGHLDIIERASKLFDQLVVFISPNSDKNNEFTEEKRLKWLNESTKHLSNVTCKIQSGLVVEACKSVNATVLVRGIRNGVDCTYEQNMAFMNARLDENIETVCLFTRPEYSLYSSSNVRELFKYGQDISGFVPACVLEDLKKGVEMTIKGFLNSLEKLGVEEIDTTNGFDPNLHQAISVVEDANLSSNDVAQVYQKGYKKGEKVIRYSMVTVAK